MMKLMNKKLTKKGFTLAELLIVVAILAILVAVSIPIFTSKLHDAKDSTDMANERAAKAAAIAAYMNTDEASGNGTYYYDAENGTVKAAKTGIKGYNQCGDENCTDGAGKDIAADANADTLIVEVKITAATATESQKIETKWVTLT